MNRMNHPRGNRMAGSLCASKSPMRWLAIFLLCLPACQTASPPAEDEHESHEHFPAHWPHTIFKASDRLSELMSNPAATSSNSSEVPHQTKTTPSHIAPHQEFVDLVGWLPILAADSDLDRATFDRIDAESTKLQSRWRKSEPKDLKILVSDQDAQEMIAWLADICRQEQARVQQYSNSP